MHVEDVVRADRRAVVARGRLVRPTVENEAQGHARAGRAVELEEGKIVAPGEHSDPRRGDALVADGAAEPVREREEVVQRIHPIGSVAGRPRNHCRGAGLLRIPPGSIIPTMTTPSTPRPSDHGSDHGDGGDHFRHSYTRDKAQLVRRLARIEGQVRGISRMIEREEYCVDILQQTSALRAAVDSLAVLVLEDHVQGCIRTAAQRGEADRYVDEVVDVVRRTLGRPVRGSARSEAPNRP